MSCIFTENVTLPQVFFKHFASKNQLPGLSISGTLAGNGRRERERRERERGEREHLPEIYIA